MATAKQQQGGDELANFEFDDSSSFFGVKDGGSGMEQVINGIRGEDDLQFDEEDDGVTPLEEELENKGAKGKVAPPVVEKSTTDEDEDEDEENDDPEKPKSPEEEEQDWFVDKDKKKPETVKPTEKVKPQVQGKDKGKTPSTQAQASIAKPEDQTDEEFFTTLASEMVDRGIFLTSVVPEGEKITEDQFFELHEGEIEARVEETVNTLFETLDDDAKAFINFKRKGGRTSDFVNYYASPFDYSKFDEENEAHQEYIVRQYATQVEGMEEDEEILDKVQYLKDSGKLKSMASKYNNAFLKKDNERKALILKSQDDRIKENGEKLKKFNTDTVKILGSTDSIGAFTLSTGDKKDLGGYITRPTFKAGKNRTVPQFQADLAKILRAETPEDMKSLILIAKLVKNNFDVTDLVTDTKTAVVKKAQSNLRKSKDGLRPHSSGYAGNKKSLHDYFESE